MKETTQIVTDTMTVGEMIKELEQLPKGAELRFTDVCGNSESEVYAIDIDANRGVVLIIGDTADE